MLAHCLRRWSNNKTALGECIVCAGPLCRDKVTTEWRCMWLVGVEYYTWSDNCKDLIEKNEYTILPFKGKQHAVTTGYWRQTYFFTQKWRIDNFKIIYVVAPRYNNKWWTGDDPALNLPMPPIIKWSSCASELDFSYIDLGEPFHQYTCMYIWLQLYAINSQ